MKKSIVHYRVIMTIIAGFSIITSATVIIIGWYFGYKDALSIISGASTMKFNTALGFLFSGIALLLLTKKHKIVSIFLLIISILISLLGILTLVQYNFGIEFGIDNLFISDIYSIKFPGRMSPATATCFALLGASFWGLDSKKSFVKSASQHTLFLISLISLVSIITHILNVPSENKSFFWSSMAIHTSILFFILSIGISLKNSNLGFTGLFTGSLTGSKLVRILLPFLIILPVFLSCLLIIILNLGQISIGFGISIYTVSFILISISFISIIGLKENKYDLYKKELESSLKEKNKELEQYTYTVSHDLQEPLRSISSLVKLFDFENNSKLNKEEIQYLSLINQASGRMSILIKELLNFSKVGKNGKVEQINCHELIVQIQEDLAASIKDNNVTLNVSELPVVLGYQTELRLLFQNLISNAIKFRFKDKNPTISISARKENDFWKFSVSDNGIGIAIEHQENIFQIFQRMHSKSEYEGTGIGLAHCQKVASMHGGSIWVSSQLGKGSTFYFTIPA